jgi:hypothetical protein
VKGVGETTLKKYLPEVSDPNANLTFDVIEQKYAGQKKIPKMIQNILASKDIIERNIKLMNLQEGIISSDSRIKIANTYRNTGVNLRKVDLTKLLFKSKLLGGLPNYDTWLATNFVPLNRFHSKENEN